MPVHPNVKSMGDRKIDVSNSKIYIESSDFGGAKIRLKGFADFDFDGIKANHVSTERSDKRPIVHWVSEDSKIEACLIFPNDGKLTRIHGVLERNNYDIGTTLQLERIGYGIMIDKSTILFTHE